jgi:MFS family permease
VTRQRAIRDRTFASLKRHYNYRLFFAGQVFSLSGTWMQSVAMYWLVLQLTHSAFAVGVLSLSRFAPSMIFAPFAGTLADRLDNRLTLVWTQAAQMVVAAGLAVLALTGNIEAWMIDLAAVLAGTVLCLDSPARQGLTFEMVGRDELPNAVALNSTLFNAARVAGPALGGTLIAAFGSGWCFAANAGSFLAVLAALLLMRADELFPLERRHPPRLLAGTREGLAFARSQPLIAASLTLITVYASLLFNVDVLLPLLANQTLHRGAGTFALFTAAFGFGAFSGALGVAARGASRWSTTVVSAIGLAVVYLAIVPLTSVPMIAVLLAVGGVMFTTLTANVNTRLQLETPDWLRGRVLSLYLYSWNALAPLGALLIAWLCSVGSARLAFGVVAVAGLATVGVVQWRLPRDSRRERGLGRAEPLFDEPPLTSGLGFPAIPSLQEEGADGSRRPRPRRR